MFGLLKRRGSSKIVITFTSVHRVDGRRTLFDNVDYDALPFHTGVVKKSTFSKYSFGREGVTKKNTLCALLIMMTILDDP